MFGASGLLLIAALVYFSLSRTVLALPVDASGHVAHVGAYTAIMFVFTRASPGARVALVTAAALFALGVGIEFLQGRTGYRNFELADMAANAVGIACGWLAARPFAMRMRTRPR